MGGFAYVAVKAAIALEEVLLHIADHALGLALHPGTLRSAGPGSEAVMASQLQETGVEDYMVTAVMLNDGGFLVIHQGPLALSVNVVVT